MRRLKDVSRVFAYRLIWKLFTLSGFLWVAWTKHNLMRKAFFWTAPSTTLGSWIWRKLLKLREEIKPFIRVSIRSGSSTSFWYDSWLPAGRILDITGPSGPRSLGIPLQASVREAFGPCGWRLRRIRLSHLAPLLDQIRAHPPPTSTGQDEFLWRHGPDDYQMHFRQPALGNRFEQSLLR